MTSRLTQIAVDCTDAEHLAAFWCAVLDWKVVDRDESDVEIGDGSDGATLLFCRVPDAKTIKNRLHLDVHPVDGDQSAEVERVIALGARPVDIGQGMVSWVVLADPEGNEFCILEGPP